MIEKLTDEQVQQLKKGCPVMSKIDVGEIVNDIIDALNNNSLPKKTLSLQDREKLNKMCPLNGVKLGDVIAFIHGIPASRIQGYTMDVDYLFELQNSHLNKLDIQCNTLYMGCLCSKLNEIIEDEVNDLELINSSSSTRNPGGTEEVYYFKTDETPTNFPSAVSRYVYYKETQKSSLEPDDIDWIKGWAERTSGSGTKESPYFYGGMSKIQNPEAVIDPHWYGTIVYFKYYARKTDK